MSAVRKKDFAAMEGGRSSGDSAARAALRSRMAHPTSLRLDEVQPNPLNPRYAEDDPEVQELAATLRRVGQLQPALVMAREQYLQAFPGQAERLGAAPWVVIVGNRRLAAARLAGRPSLDVRVAADLVTAEDVEDRVLIENLQRKNLPPLLEAAHLQRRLARPGQTIRSVGEAIGKSHTYVQQRLDLLQMIPEFQALFRNGVINIRTGRQLGALPEQEQRAILAAGPPYSPGSRNGKAGGADAVRGNPVSTPDRYPDPTPSGSSGDGRAGRPDRGRSPASGPRDLDAAQHAVARWLDSAAAELDRALPVDDGDDERVRTLADVRRHIEEARAALRRSVPAM